MLMSAMKISQHDERRPSPLELTVVQDILIIADVAYSTLWQQSLETIAFYKIDKGTPATFGLTHKI